MKRRSVRWSAVGQYGLEHLELRTSGIEILATSVVIGTFNGLEHGTHYILRIGLDSNPLSVRQTDTGR